MLLAHLGADEVDELDAPVEIQPQLLHNPVEVEAVLGGAVLEEGAIRVEPCAAEQAQQPAASVVAVGAPVIPPLLSFFFLLLVGP